MAKAFNIPEGRKAVLKRRINCVISGTKIKNGWSGIVVPSPLEENKFMFYPTMWPNLWKGIGVEVDKSDFGFKEIIQLNLFD